MNKEAKIKQNNFAQRYGINFKSFFTLVKMMSQNSMKLDFKHNTKNTIIKIVLYVLGFAAIVYLAKTFFQYASLMNVFSVMGFVPLEVPSLVTSVIFIIGLIPLLIKITKVLYFAPDLKLVKTFPCNGSTIFLARLVTVFISEFLKTILIEVSFLFGYSLAMGFPNYDIIVTILAWFIFDIAAVGVCSLLSIPSYYIGNFFKKHRVLTVISILTITAAVVALVFWVVYLIPNEIDIFTNWGPYFAAIQDVLKFYRTNFTFFYNMTELSVGAYTGFSLTIFGGKSLITLLIFLAIIVASFALALFTVNPLYTHIAGNDKEYFKKPKINKKSHELPYFLSQMKKETVMLFSDPQLVVSFLAPLISLPILVLFINRIFGAMKLDAMGVMYVNAVNVLIILLVLLSSNSSIASLYSNEGSAFELQRTYPRKQIFLLTSKLFLPMIFAIISIIVSTIIFGQLIKIDYSQIAFYIFSFIAFDLGHMFYAAGIDIARKHSNFDEEQLTRQGDIAIVAFAFGIALIMAFLTYLLINQRTSVPGLHILVFALAYFIINFVIYIEKIKFIYERGSQL
jgi:hypothetical protein